MKVKIKQYISGSRNGQKWPAPGGELVVGDQEGAELCANGYAEPVAETPKPEKRTTKRKS